MAKNISSHDHKKVYYIQPSWKKQFSTLVFAFNLLDSQICRNVRQLTEILLSFFLLLLQLHALHLVKQTSKVPLISSIKVELGMEKTWHFENSFHPNLELLSSHFSLFSHIVCRIAEQRNPFFCIRGVTKDFSGFSDSTLNIPDP